MSDARADAAAGGRVWGVSLAAVLAFCLIAALNAQAGSTDWHGVGLTAVIALIYAVVFVLFVGRVAHRTPAAYVAAALTVLMVGVMTAVVPSSAVLQFWAFPLLWALLPAPRLAIPASFALAVAAFAGFAVSTTRDYSG
jgi:hypothetical protein